MRYGQLTCTNQKKALLEAAKILAPSIVIGHGKVQTLSKVYGACCTSMCSAMRSANPM